LLTLSLYHTNKISREKTEKKEKTKCTSFEHEVSKDLREYLKDLFKLENLDPIPLEGNREALAPCSGLLSIALESEAMKNHRTQ